MLDKSKLENALQRNARSARLLCISACCMTTVAVGDAAVAVIDGRVLLVLLDVALFFTAGIQWAAYMAVSSSHNTLTVVRDSLVPKGSLNETD